MKKRLTALLLVMVMVLGMLPTTAFAASSEEEALGEVNIYNGGQTLSYLSINGRIRELVYTYFNYVDRNGNTKEIPAYCVNPNTKGVPQTVAPGESIKYLAKEKGSDPKVMGIIANGYPTRGLSLLKLENKYHAYYATKMALWCYLLPNWNINNLKVWPFLPLPRTSICVARHGTRSMRPVSPLHRIAIPPMTPRWTASSISSRYLPSTRTLGCATTPSG